MPVRPPPRAPAAALVLDRIPDQQRHRTASRPLTHEDAVTAGQAAAHPHRGAQDPAAGALEGSHGMHEEVAAEGRAREAGGGVEG